jgi:hypothetical protein
MRYKRLMSTVTPRPQVRLAEIDAALLLERMGPSVRALARDQQVRGFGAVL